MDKVIELKGRIDSNNIEGIESDVLKEIEGFDGNIIFDAKELEYISSAGLRILLVMQKKMNAQGKMIVRNVNEEISKVFSVTGFDSILTVE